ncbi:hypothetical protein SFR_1783 [Streptomyces sp. FR-008]|nr:hypothetical protein SFR_1783 [Streptomyces sp. FR-008]
MPARVTEGLKRRPRWLWPGFGLRCRWSSVAVTDGLKRRPGWSWPGWGWPGWGWSGWGRPDGIWRDLVGGFGGRGVA